MKLFFLAALAASVLTAVVAQTVTPGTWDLYTGTRKASEHQTLDECVQAAEARGAGSYGCRNIVRVVVPEPQSGHPAPHHQDPRLPAVDVARIPAPAEGYSTERVSSGGANPRPAGDSIGAFRTVCDYSHFNFDDPLVFPGQVGRTHLHLYLGNTSVMAHTTDMRAQGNSTCLGGTVNRTGYWVPAVIDTRTSTPVRPMLANIYYKTGYRGVRNQDVRAWPQGLRMLAGDPMNSSALPNWERNWTWHCHNGNYDPRNSIPTDCPSGTEIVMEINFPQCWDGVNLDSPDHRSHMAYATTGRGCPASHPVPIPEISYNVSFIVPPEGTSSWRLSSDAYEGPAGYSMHADWWDGWRPDVVQDIINNCINPGNDCSGMLGGGRTIY